MPDSAIANFERYASGGFWNRLTTNDDPTYLAGSYTGLVRATPRASSDDGE